MNRKQQQQQSSALFPPSNDDDDDQASRSSNNFTSSLALLNPPPLFPTRRRFEHTPNPQPTPPNIIRPKPEPNTDPFSLPPFPTSTFHHPNAPFHHLPALHSPTSSSSQKRPRDTHQQQQQQQQQQNALVPTPTSILARQRRAQLSDKTRCLQKLIPHDRQMNTAQLYHETYKYIKFLEAQVAVLQSMPVYTSLPPPPPPLHTSTATTSTTNRFDGLARLNRQQLLQVLMNSQVAQTVMYTNGWCVFSAEQLAALLHLRDQQVVVQQRFI